MLELSIDFSLEESESLQSAYSQSSSIIQAWAWRPKAELIQVMAHVSWWPTQEKWGTFFPARFSIYHYSVSAIILGFYSCATWYLRNESNSTPISQEQHTHKVSEDGHVVWRGEHWSGNWKIQDCLQLSVPEQLWISTCFLFLIYKIRCWMIL